MNTDSAYFQAIDPERREAVAAYDPTCLYLEVSNECNLTCKTCPLTYGKAEEPAALGFEQVQQIVSQFPDVKRVTLHGVGEPLLNRDLPKIIRWLKEQGIHVLFNSNGTLMNRRWQEALIASGLDEIRLSLDAATPETFARVRGKPLFEVIVKNIRGLMALKIERGSPLPLVSLWLTGLRETIKELPDFIRLAHSLGVDRVHLQRLVYWEEENHGRLATAGQSLFGSLRDEEEEIIASGQELARELGISFEASGATSPAASLARRDREQPWKDCMRPWTLMYISARGSCFPCCIAPFSTKDLGSLSLGNAFAEDLATIWNGKRYQEFRQRLLSPDPPECCVGCGACWSL
ncbi:MAG: radical SAM protein [Candidatus Tectomicrobia bacterium]|uniref:Radical SAM protein n=1 Tax=Tectimicrobiota bacterium TaxID=2528274 RepID=A0A932M0U3_UNCTE|nr:radical SAM protein [Candidatus Tectomicrobia bacterium]